MKRVFIIFLVFLACLPAAPARAGFDDQFIESGDIGESKVPHTGRSRILVIPIIIEGIPEPDMTRWNSFFENKLEASTFRNYWHVNSLGSYDVEVTVIEPLRYGKCPLPDSFKNCAVPRGDVKALQPAIDTIKDVFDRARKERGVNFADYDINGPERTADGWADGVMIMSNADFPGVALPVSMFKNIKRDGVNIGAVAICGLNEEEVVALHEFGHLLGFGDLYHEHKAGRGTYLSLMGQYDKGLPLLDAYSRIKIGWADVVDVTGAPETVRIPPAETSGRVVRIGGKKEFFLLENRGPGKFFDTKLKAPGLAVYHIDESNLPKPGKWTFVQFFEDCLNCDEWRPLIMNVQPDGSFGFQLGNTRDPNTGLFHAGDSLMPDYMSQNQLSADRHALNSNWHNGEPSDIKIFDIDDNSHLPAITVRVGFD